MTVADRRVASISGAWISFGAACVAMLGACDGRYEELAQRDLTAQTQRYQGNQGRDGQPVPDLAEVATRGDLDGYVALALQHSPEIRAAFERWSAGVLRISQARKLPEPTLSFGYFLRSIETRVGPQLARLSLQQTFPWPSKLSAGADSASARARALQRRFEAQTLSVRQRVASAYWSLWQVRATRVLSAQHLEVLQSMSESLRARMVTGSAALADVQQLDLRAARLEDDLRSMDEADRALQAQLCAELGRDCTYTLRTNQAPPNAGLPRDESAVLLRGVAEHPMLQSTELLAEAADASADMEAADRLPSFSLGADWVITGQSTAHSVPDTGKDAVMLAAGLRLPLWQGSYADAEEAARADARGQRAERDAQLARARALLAAALSNVRDGARRVALYRETLVPQAQSAYESVLGSYTVGRSNVAEVLLAQRELLDLRVMLESARAEHARAWARLEEVVGQELASEGASDASAPPAASASTPTVQARERTPDGPEADGAHGAIDE